VLVDSEHLALRVHAEHITALGLPTTFEDCVRDFLGIGMPATVAELERRLGRPLPSGGSRNSTARSGRCSPRS